MVEKDTDPFSCNTKAELVAKIKEVVKDFDEHDDDDKIKKINFINTIWTRLNRT